MTTEHGEEVDLTPLLQAYQGIPLSAMQSRKHEDPGSIFLGVPKDTVYGVKMGVKMGVQIAVHHAYSKESGDD